jgi:2-polyprenyl-3-methyl-5-hydroxy-6-metoxy-1,4-benzoquinol methylase
MAVNEAKLKEFLQKAIGDVGAGMSAVLVLIGDQLGLYKAMAHAGPMTPAELAARTGTAERYIREWLANQAAGAYVTYDPATGEYTLPDEQASALADEDGPFFMAGSFQSIAAMWAAEPRATQNFRTGAGMDWCQHDHRLFVGTERLFRPGYIGNLTSQWIPALEGVEAKLRQGIKVADIGCGHGASTIIMAKAYPNSQFTGFDYHEGSIAVARERARLAGIADRVHFEAARSTDYPGKNYAFVTHFDCLHDMGDPVGAARHVRETLTSDGTWMIVEPFANDKIEDNLNPIGRMMYAASTMICVPASLAHNGPALGAQAGEARLRDVALSGGFTRFRRATQTLFNLVLEARP